MRRCGGTPSTNRSIVPRCCDGDTLRDRIQPVLRRDLHTPWMESLGQFRDRSNIHRSKQHDNLCHRLLPQARRSVRRHHGIDIRRRLSTTSRTPWLRGLGPLTDDGARASHDRRKECEFCCSDRRDCDRARGLSVPRDPLFPTACGTLGCTHDRAVNAP